MAGKKSSGKHHVRKSRNVVQLLGGSEKAAMDRNYHQALKSYWEGRTRTAIERVGQAIVDTPNVPAKFPLYRLWIEVLADGKEGAALSHLADHLIFLIETEPEAATTFLALKGLVHFELDEVDAATVIAKAIRGEHHNPYALELCQLVDDRTSVHFKASLLSKVEGDLQDYFHFVSLAKSLVLHNHDSEYHHLARRIKAMFPNTPLLDDIELMSFVAKKDYARAQTVAERLSKNFPGNLEHSIHYAYVATRTKTFDSAIAELYRALSLHTEGDGDLHSLLGYALSEKAISQNDKISARKAKENLEKAVTLYRDLGVPVGGPQSHLDRLQKAFSPPQQMASAEPRRNWLIKLSERKFYDLKTSPQDAVRTMRRAMGAVPRPGDHCFFVGSDYQNSLKPVTERHWRLGAIYEVISEPIWHPSAQFQSRLSLLARPEVSIPIPVHEFDRMKVVKPRHRDPNNALHFGVYALDDAAIHGIEIAIADFAAEYQDLKQVLR